MRKLPKTYIFLMLPKIYMYLLKVYIAPSNGEPLPNLNLPFKWILRKFEIVFYCLEWECSTF